MDRRDVLSIVMVTLAFAAGCGGAPEEEPAEDVGTAASAVLNENALNANALNANALNANALNANGLMGSMLAPLPLSPATIGATALAAILDPGPSGDLSRQLLKYTVSCAFDETQGFSFAWVDASGVTHNETYPGLLALAPSWATLPLGASAQRWVSACLISRVNYYGTPVTLSARASIGALKNTDAGERSAYTMLEGAFWGNVFSATPYAFACDLTADDAYSRSQLRDCAAGHVDSAGNVTSCANIQRLGSCDSVGCDYSSNKTYYTGCNDPVAGGVTGQIVTIFLHN